MWWVRDWGENPQSAALSGRLPVLDTKIQKFPGESSLQAMAGG
jgi:hypothetical protein